MYTRFPHIPVCTPEFAILVIFVALTHHLYTRTIIYQLHTRISDIGLRYRGTLTKIVFFFSGVLCSFFTLLYLFHCARRDLDLVPHTAMREINLNFLLILVGVFHSSTRLHFLSGLVSFFKGLFNYARPIT